MAKPIRNIVCLSDTHIGSTLGLCKRHKLDSGGFYEPSPLQNKLWLLWEDFWAWTYDKLKGEPFMLVHNGDIMDGLNKMRTSELSTFNLTVQGQLAVAILKPHVDKAARYFQIRGTEAHVGISAQDEEAVAAILGAEKDEHGNYSRWEMWMKFGPNEMIHFSHHIGVTSSTAYESSAPMRELAAAFTESGQHKLRPPTVIVRSHRHRCIIVEPPGGVIAVTPGWQLKTPHVYKMDSLRAPQMGGILIQLDSEDQVKITKKVYFLKQNKAVIA